MSHPSQQVNEKDTAAWKLFNIMFNCTVRTVDTNSVDYLMLRGSPTLNDNKKDKHTALSAVYREMTINNMVELYKSGAVINIVNTADTKRIYEIVAEHLENWKQYLNTQLNTRDAPLDDLVELDRFASAVYKHAVPHFTKEIAVSFMDNSLAARMKAAIMVSLGQETPGTLPDLPKEMPAERQSLAGTFKSFVKGSNGEKKWS